MMKPHWSKTVTSPCDGYLFNVPLAHLINWLCSSVAFKIQAGSCILFGRGKVHLKCYFYKSKVVQNLCYNILDQ